MERACQEIGRCLARLRAAQPEFARRPAYARWYTEDALWLPDLHELLCKARVDLVPLEPSLREAEEAAEYAREALKSRAWDAAAEDLARVINAVSRVYSTLGSSRRFLTSRLRRHPTTEFVRGSIRLFRPDIQPHAAWRRLEASLWTLASLRKRPVNHIHFALDAYAWPDHLRPYVVAAVRGAHRDVRREVMRLLDEGQEAAEYACAEFEQNVWNAAQIDLERLDTCLRAIRHIVEREATVYLPEPWPLRLPARQATLRRMRSEAVERA